MEPEDRPPNRMRVYLVPIFFLHPASRPSTYLTLAPHSRSPHIVIRVEPPIEYSYCILPCTFVVQVSTHISSSRQQTCALEIHPPPPKKKKKKSPRLARSSPAPPPSPLLPKTAIDQLLTRLAVPISLFFLPSSSFRGSLHPGACNYNQAPGCRRLWPRPAGSSRLVIRLFFSVSALASNHCLILLSHRPPGDPISLFKSPRLSLLPPPRLHSSTYSFLPT